MPVTIDELSKNSMGGTEQMKFGLAARLDSELLNQFQIIPSRVRELDPRLIPIYWLHDLPGDPESEHLANGGWNKFEKLVFVSNWQMQAYINHYNIPWSKCVVLQNAITPIPKVEKTFEKIKLIYHTTPHRGLEILVPVFMELVKYFPNLQLDVYSSFKIYGWEQRDKPYAELFKACEEHPNINYHGFQPNNVIRDALQQAHIFAFPSIWPETSCIAMLEALSAGCLVVHSNLAALPETASNFTWMYQYQEDIREHMLIFFNNLQIAIQKISDPDVQRSLETPKNYVDNFFAWDLRINEWDNFLNGILEQKNKYKKVQP